MNPKFYVVVLIVMFSFLLLTSFRWIIVVVGILFGAVTLVRYLFWRNQFDYQ